MSGVTCACLKVCGNTPSERDKFTIEVIGFTKESIHDLTSSVGHGSRLHCLLGEDLTNLRITFSDTAEKLQNSGGVTGGMSIPEIGSHVLFRVNMILSILSVKKLPKLSTSIFKEEQSGRTTVEVR